MRAAHCIAAGGRRPTRGVNSGGFSIQPGPSVLRAEVPHTGFRGVIPCP